MANPPLTKRKSSSLWGNKDTYGFSFVFLDSSSIASIGRPANLLVVERIEHGDAFGTPLALQLADGRRVEQDHLGSTRLCKNSFATVTAAALKLRKSKG